MIIQPEKFATRSLSNSPWGQNICRVLSAAIQAADPGEWLTSKVVLDAGVLCIDNVSFDLSSYRHIYVIGAGKAVVPMAEAVVQILGNLIYSGVVITKDGYASPNKTFFQYYIELIQAGHPLPDQRNVTATDQLITLCRNLSPDDLVICLISGGGSALMLHPSNGLALKDIQETTSALLSCGASIAEINTVRKHMDDIKGGGLARLIFPAHGISLILSDVIGDGLDMIASGPTVSDPTTFVDAQQVLEKYQVWNHVPTDVRTHLTAGIARRIPETVKPGDPVLDKVHNILIGNNSRAAVAAVQAAHDIGLCARFLPIPIQGEASIAGQAFVEQVQILLDSNRNELPSCFVAGGETTVTIKGPGKGGRNQELALGAVKSLASTSNLIMVSLATDGGDGPTDAAGAVATSETFSYGQAKGLDPAEYLLRNDSYNYFNQLNDLIKIGPTMTNVNDLLFIFGK